MNSLTIDPDFYVFFWKIRCHNKSVAEYCEFVSVLFCQIAIVRFSQQDRDSSKILPTRSRFWFPVSMSVTLLYATMLSPPSLGFHHFEVRFRDFLEAIIWMFLMIVYRTRVQICRGLLRELHLLKLLIFQ